MDNTEETIQLQVPTLPAGWNPKGNVRDVFDNFIETVLKKTNAIIPGLGNFSIQDVAQMQEQIQQLQNEVQSLTKVTYSFETPVVILNDITTVALPVEMPNSDYFVGLTLIDAGAVVSTNPPTASLIASSRTSTQFQFRSNNLPITWKVLVFVRQN